MIRLENVVMTYQGTGGKVLDGISLTVKPGDFTAIVGPSGGGKTTLLNIIGCLLRPTAGKVFFQGQELTGLGDRERSRLRRHKMGFVFQGSNLVSTLTALENVVSPLLFQKIWSWKMPREAKEKGIALLEEMGLGDRLHHYPHQLSFGQRRRVAIARALIHEPEILLADEPTNDLDPERARQVGEILDRLHAQGLTLLLVTHEWDTARRAKNLYEIRKGKLCRGGMVYAP